MANNHVVDILRSQDIVLVILIVKLATAHISENIAFKTRGENKIPVKFRVFETNIILQVILNFDLEVLLGRCGGHN
jgi:hypothetical protein